MSTTEETNEAVGETAAELREGEEAAASRSLRERLAEEKELVTETPASEAVDGATEPDFEVEAVPEHERKGGGMNPIAVIAIAFVVGLFVARMLTWSERARSS